MKPPRILMLTPSALPVITGNAMTVERWRRAAAGGRLSRLLCPQVVLLAG